MKPQKTRFSVDDLTDFLIVLNEKGLIDDYNLDYEHEAKEYFETIFMKNRKERARKKKPPVIKGSYETLLFSKDHELLDNSTPEELRECFDIANGIYLFFKDIYEQINLSPHKLNKTATGAWVFKVKELMEKNNATIVEFRKIFLYLKSNHFWRSKILNIYSLDRHFDRLLIEANSYEKQKTGNGTNPNGSGKQEGATTDEIANLAYKHFGDGNY